MRITKDLQLTFSVETEKYGTVHVHSTPITRSTFETYYAELGLVFSKCFGDSDAQHLALVGPQIAFPALKAAALSLGTWDTPSGVRLGLVNEITRLTTVVYADQGGGGWRQIPLANAEGNGVVDEDSAAEIMNVIVYFTAVSRAAPRQLAETLLPMAGESRGWAFGSWAISEFMSSLPPLTPAASSTPNQVLVTT